MAFEAALSRSIRRLVEVFKEYAAVRRWQEADYKLLLRPVPEWNRIHVFLLANAFPGPDLDVSWESVVDFLEIQLKDEEPLLNSINLVLSTFSQVEEGGLYSIPDDYFDPEELLDGRVPGWPPTVDAISRFGQCSSPYPPYF